jgi:hypothetical protein
MVATKLKARDPKLVLPGKCKGLLFGASGAGKTWFALSFPRPYYIDTEGGADLRHYQARLQDAGGAYMGQEDGSLNFDTVLEQVRALSTEKHDYRTLIFDSATKLYQTAIAHESERLGAKDAFGASKKPAIGYMRRLVSAIQRLDMNVWFVAHEVAEWGMVGEERKQIGVAPDIWDKLVYELDLTLQIKKLGKGQREAVVYKSRLTGFPEFDRFYTQKANEECGYVEFAERYGKDYIETEPVAIVLASAEQVTEIRRLLEVVRIPEAETEKMLTKAGVETWDELTTEQAQKAIDWMLGKIKKESA